ncbi:neurotrophin receptor-interacting factor 1 isoform X2 [Orussus abietinus]|uniref:neurotrophin receptor-interacting factor 1 isoform X2 n=1 Tax=Orussus abietinus TaxID=222816 RepID=UPI000C715DCD|nr:neurotrophin receptor-interacting factor 1 isoform X2 [Orussus abietinus]
MELPQKESSAIRLSVVSEEVSTLLREAEMEEEIIYNSGGMDDCSDAEVEEIVEIIEEIEEVEEDDVEKELLSKGDDMEIEKELEENDRLSKKDYVVHKESEMLIETMTKPIKKSSENPAKKHSNKQVVTYDVDEDWEDEDIEHDQYDPKATRLLGNKTESEEFINSKSQKRCESLSEYDRHMNGTRTIEIANSSQHEIVKNAENNLVYTVLGSKKQSGPVKTSEDKFSSARYMKLQEDTIPVEGTIYYEGDDIETLYMSQTSNDNEQYQYGSNSMEQEEQEWESADQSTDQQREEENSQDQIFLHEDEDGQLYFKDDNGTLQPVYLTPDGNYAIAENSNEDRNSPESETQVVQHNQSESGALAPSLEMRSGVNSKQTTVVPASSLNDVDNEDNTVTISLIISEDEHGQKRTQVIIPTTDNLKCEICNKSFKTSFQLLRHNRLKHAREEDITTRNFPCDLCPKRYPDQNTLARHRKSHTGDRPYQCLECHKSFPTSTALRRHLTLHNNQSRPLPCIYCGRRFMEKSSLARHEESHLSTNQGSLACEICHKVFLDETDLSMHKKYHDPDRKFDCEVCGREFNRLNNLQRHMMVHQQQGANEEILACDVCGITYKFMSSLTRHMVTTHMNPEKLRQQAEEQRRKRENNYRRYLENRKMYETQHSGYSLKRSYNATRAAAENDDENV